MIFLKVAWQNLFKHWKRTLLVLFAVTLSVAVILFVSGMMEGMKANFFRNMLQESGHVQILSPGRENALNPLDLKYLLPDPAPLLSRLAEDPRVTAAEPVLTFGCLLLAGEKNLSIIGAGTRGDTVFFSRAAEGLEEGRFLSPEDPPGLVMSRRIAALLGVGLGDPVVVLTEDSTGSPWYVEYPVSGIFETDSRDFDESMVFLPHREAESLLYVPGRTREIRVLLSDPEKAEALAVDIAGMPGTAGTEVKTWREIHGSYMVILDLFDIFMVFMNLFTVVVVATVITNSILMNVFEHTREYGTLRAIGMKRRQLFGLIMTEGVVQGVLGSLLGLAAGIPPVLYFQVHGMNWGEITESFGMGSSFSFSFTPVHALTALATGILIACGGSLYAGLVSVRRSIMESLTAV